MECIVLRDNNLLFNKDYFDIKQIQTYIKLFQTSFNKTIFDIPIPVELFLKIPYEIFILKRGVFENNKLKTGFINNVLLYEGEFENNILRKGKISKNSYIYSEGEYDINGKLIKGYFFHKGLKYDV